MCGIIGIVGVDKKNDELYQLMIGGSAEEDASRPFVVKISRKVCVLAMTRSSTTSSLRVVIPMRPFPQV